MGFDGATAWVGGFAPFALPLAALVGGPAPFASPLATLAGGYAPFAFPLAALAGGSALFAFALAPFAVPLAGGPDIALASAAALTAFFACIISSSDGAAFGSTSRFLFVPRFSLAAASKASMLTFGTPCELALLPLLPLSCHGGSGPSELA